MGCVIPFHPNVYPRQLYGVYNPWETMGLGGLECHSDCRKSALLGTFELAVKIADEIFVSILVCVCVCVCVRVRVRVRVRVCVLACVLVYV